MDTYMGIDQYGQSYHNLGKHPRKALLDLFSSTHADKMYVDKKDGRQVHIGYIISGLWITLYHVTRYEKVS